MPISESTMEIWSHIGAIQQSASTYQAIKSVLEDQGSPYRDRSFGTFLQGSYGNQTNIRLDSDVDIVIFTDEIFYYDVSSLGAEDKSRFDQFFPSTEKYSYGHFKKAVHSWLVEKYGLDVKLGTKAISIKGAGARRDADVLVSAEFRHYWEFPAYGQPRWASGIVFWKSDGKRIVNFPKQHLDNCTAKHKATDEWFKPVVRLFKNMRNRMIAEGYLEEGVAPSYYIEGLLSNVANSSFGHSFERTVLNCIFYMQRAEISRLTCANGIHWLVRDGSDVSWSSANYMKYVAAVAEYWDKSS